MSYTDDADRLLEIAEEDDIVRKAIAERTIEGTCDSDSIVASLAVAVLMMLEGRDAEAIKALDSAADFAAGLLVKEGYLRKYEDAAERESKLDAQLRDANL